MASPSSRNQTQRLVVSFATFAAFAILVLSGAAQSDRSHAEALAKRAGERLVALQREADRLASDERSLLNDLRKLDVERQMRTEELMRADAEAAKVRADIDDATRRIDTLQASEEAARPELRSRLVEMYKLGKARYARVLLSTPDLRRIGQAARTVAALAKLDRERLEQYQRTIEELTSIRTTLEQRQRQAAAARADAEKAQLAAGRAAQAKNDLVREIDRRRDLNAQLASELQAAQSKLQAALRDASGAASDSAALPIAPFRGDLGWPTAGQLRRRFGGPPMGVPTSSNGIEIDSDSGTPVVAVHDGTVAFAGGFTGYGNLVILDHGSQAFSLYGDLLDIAVAKGARIDRGQPVGSVGPLPSGGTGLYFELRIDGRPVDPLQWLRHR
jgi:septal ring factor EnvC (AmiA/AmiB activator)